MLSCLQRQAGGAEGRAYFARTRQAGGVKASLLTRSIAAVGSTKTVYLWSFARRWSRVLRPGRLQRSRRQKPPCWCKGSSGVRSSPPLRPQASPTLTLSCREPSVQMVSRRLQSLANWKADAFSPTMMWPGKRLAALHSCPSVVQFQQTAAAALSRAVRADFS